MGTRRVGRFLQGFLAHDADGRRSYERRRRRAVNAPIAVEEIGRAQFWLGDDRGQTPVGMPLRRGLAHIGATRKGRQDGRTTFGREGTFDARGLEVAR
ncbi:MAG: hypothetical protein M3P47_06215 [Pseudomonadota bacterium]|nr:hypothetical protein [Pseudomonadota bacterium]